jgi:two-component SAPR family response regulator
MRILLIDDDLESLDLLSQIILNIDPLHDITSCHSSYDALQKIRKKKFDIIITEVFLQGGIQGNQLMESVSKKIFRIGMAKVLESPMIRQPFNHFFLKPVTPKMLKEAFKMAEFNLQYHLIS